MMKMVVEINERHLRSCESRRDASFEVTCTACHAGRIDPRPLPETRLTTYRALGIEAAISRYREVRERYFGADAAVAPAEVNAESKASDPAARVAWIGLGLARSVARSGVEEALRLFETLAVFPRNLELFPEAYVPKKSLADALGLGGEREAAVRMFEAWLERHLDHEMAPPRLTNLRDEMR